MKLSFCRLGAATAMVLFAAAPHAAVAQSDQQNVTGGTQPQADDQSGGQNEHGWPTDYTAQVGAGTTNGATTGSSGPEDTQAASSEPSLPDLPGPALCDDWKGTEAHQFCMEKLVR